METRIFCERIIWPRYLQQRSISTSNNDAIGVFQHFHVLLDLAFIFSLHKKQNHFLFPIEHKETNFVHTKRKFFFFPEKNTALFAHTDYNRSIGLTGTLQIFFRTLTVSLENRGAQGSSPVRTNSGKISKGREGPSFLLNGYTEQASQSACVLM